MQWPNRGEKAAGLLTFNTGQDTRYSGCCLKYQLQQLNRMKLFVWSQRLTLGSAYGGGGMVLNIFLFLKSVKKYFFMHTWSCRLNISLFIKRGIFGGKGKSQMAGVSLEFASYVENCSRTEGARISRSLDLYSCGKSHSVTAVAKRICGALKRIHIRSL